LDSKAQPDGLYLKILISKTVPDIWQQIKEGVLNKFSVRGRILEAEKEWVARLSQYARVIRKMHLVEVSLVAVPANPQARAIRWYVEKALDEFEKAGGELANRRTKQGGRDMGKETVTNATRPSRETSVVPEGDVEILEATGEPVAIPEGDGAPEPASDHAVRKEGDSHPPLSGRNGVDVCRIVALVDELLAGEEDEARRKSLSELRSIAAVDSGPSANKAAAAPKADATPPTRVRAETVEKAGRKISTARLSRLKKLVDELKSFIDEVDTIADEKAASEAPAGGTASDRVSVMEDTVTKIAKALGIAESPDGSKGPDLVEAVGGLVKRLDALEGVPAVRTSLDGQEELPGRENGKKAVWKGLV
jgi:hypothetical protein